MRRIGTYRVELQHVQATIALNETPSAGFQTFITNYAIYGMKDGAEVPLCLCQDAETAYWMAYAMARADEASEEGGTAE